MARFTTRIAQTTSAKCRCRRRPSGLPCGSPQGATLRYRVRGAGIQFVGGRGHQPAERDQGHAPGSAYRGSTARERQCPAARAHPQRVATRESRPRLYCCSHFPTSSCRCIFLCLSGEHRCRRPIFRASGKSAPAPACGASVGRSARGGGRKWRSSSRYVGTVGRLMVVTAVAGVVFV